LLSILHHLLPLVLHTTFQQHRNTVYRTMFRRLQRHSDVLGL